MIWIIVLASIAAIAGIGMLLASRRTNKLRSEISGTSTTRINYLQANERAEIKGSLITDSPLQGPGNAGECVHYSYMVERRERQRDADGDSRWVWKVIDTNEFWAPAFVEDETGKIKINPEKAQIEAPEVHSEVSEAEQGFKLPIPLSMKFGGLNIDLPSGSELTRLTVWAIKPNEQVYILGDVFEDDDGLVITKGEGRFLISTRDEEEIVKSLNRQYWLLYGFGGVLLIGGLMGLIYILTN